MHFLRDAILTIVGLLVVGAVLAYLQVMDGGLSAAEQPSVVEKAVAARLLKLSVPPEAKKASNPYATEKSAWREASEHFDDHCAMCHGRDGRGGTPIGRNMYPKVPDLSASPTQHLSDGELYYIIQNGVRWTGMPGWMSEHTEEETWKLVSFVRQVPELTPNDLDESGATKRGQTAQPHHH